MAKEAGVDVLDVSRGTAHSAGVKFEVPSIDIPRGFNVKTLLASGKPNRYQLRWAHQ